MINLALGFTDQMYCLACLGNQNEKSPADLLDSLKDYISSRECFAKQWVRYSSVNYCPDPAGCIPDECFR